MIFYFDHISTINQWLLAPDHFWIIFIKITKIRFSNQSPIVLRGKPYFRLVTLLLSIPEFVSQKNKSKDKNVKTYLFIALTCLVGFMQQEEPLSKVANIELPQKSQRISQKDVTDFKSKRFKSDNPMSKLGHVYRVDGIIFGFKDYTSAKDDFTALEDKKNEWLGVMNEVGLKSNVTRAEIIKVNNTRFLICTSLKDGEYYSVFTSDKKGRKGISGSLQYVESDKVKADNILNEILKRLSFNAPSLSGDN